MNGLGQIFGSIQPPQGVNQYGSLEEGGLISFLSNIIKLIAVIAGIFALVNFVLAGLEYMGSSGDPKKTGSAWSKIWMSLVGLLIIVSSFVIAAIIGWVLFGDWRAILSPKIYGPGEAGGPIKPIK